MTGPAPQAIPLPLALLIPASRTITESCASSEQDDRANSTICSDSSHVSLPDSTLQLLDEIQWQGETTLVMHNVPPRFSIELLLKCLQPEGDIDFIFLPYRPQRRCCSRYAFVNFVNSEAARQFAKRWTGAGAVLWGANNSTQCKQTRALALGLARTQGLARNLQLHMKALLLNDRFAPIVFNRSERLRFPSGWANIIGMVSEHEWASIKDTMSRVIAEAREGGTGPDAVYSGAPKSLAFSLHL